MAQDNKLQADGSSKQKLIAIGFIAVVIFLGWQLMGLFGGNGAEPPPPPPNVPATAASQPQSPATPPGAIAQEGAPAPAPAAPLPPQRQNVNVSEIMAADSELFKQQEETQKKYLEALNTLQILKVERETQEVKQAIAASKLATVTAEKNMTDVLTQPALPQVPVSVYADKLAGGPQGLDNPAGGPQGKPPTAAVPEVSYLLLSVSMQFNKWHAVLGYQGKLYDVALGDTLPPDGSIVGAINKDSVVLLDKNGKKTKVNIVSSI